MDTHTEDNSDVQLDNLVNVFDQFVDRPFEALWGECGLAENARDTDSQRSKLRQVLKEAGLQGLVVLRYSPLTNRLYPIRPLIISSLSLPLEKENSYFCAWSGDENAEAGRLGSGFLAGFVSDYYSELISKLGGTGSADWRDAARQFLRFRGYEALISGFPPDRWLDWTIRPSRGEKDETHVRHAHRLLARTVCAVVNNASSVTCPYCPEPKIIFRQELPSELARIAFDAGKRQRLFDAIDDLSQMLGDDPWWWHDDDYQSHADDVRIALNHLRQMIKDWPHILKIWRSKKALELEAKRVLSKQDTGDEHESTEHARFLKPLCKVIRQFSPVWPCSVNVMGWEDRLGVPIVSQGELIGILAIGFADNSFGDQPHKKLKPYLRRLERVCEGLVLSCDHIAGDPSLPLSVFHDRVATVSSAATGVIGAQAKRAVAGSVSDLEFNLSLEQATATALMELFGKALVPENATLYGQVADTISSNQALPFADANYNERYIAHLRALEAMIRDALPLEGGGNHHYDRWLLSLGFGDSSASKLDKRASWLIGHLWHPQTETKPVKTLLALGMGKQWDSRSWYTVRAVYALMPESLRCLFFLREEPSDDGQDEAKHSHYGYQPFSLWMMPTERSTRRSSAINPDNSTQHLLFRVPTQSESEVESDGPTSLRHIMAYSEHTIVLARDDLWLFPWAPEIIAPHEYEGLCPSIAETCECVSRLATPQQAHQDGGKWTVARDELARRILFGRIEGTGSEAEKLKQRAEAWRKLTNGLALHALRDDQARRVLRSIAVQLFLNLESEKPDAWPGDGQYLRNKFRVVENLLTNVPGDTKDAGSATTGSVVFDEVILDPKILDYDQQLEPIFAEAKRPYGDEEKNEYKALFFAAHFLLNVMSWEWKYLYFFPASTGIRHPHGGIVCSFIRPLSDAEFEAFQRCTEEVFLPAYEHADRLARERDSRQAERVRSTRLLMHNLKNTIEPLVESTDQIVAFYESFWKHKAFHYRVLANELTNAERQLRDKTERLMSRAEHAKLISTYVRTSIHAFYQWLRLGEWADTSSGSAGDLLRESVSIAFEFARAYKPSTVNADFDPARWQSACTEWRQTWGSQAISVEDVMEGWVSVKDGAEDIPISHVPIAKLVLVELAWNALKGMLYWHAGGSHQPEDPYKLSISLNAGGGGHKKRHAVFTVMNSVGKQERDRIEAAVSSDLSHDGTLTASGLAGAIEIARACGASISFESQASIVEIMLVWPPS